MKKHQLISTLIMFLFALMIKSCDVLEAVAKLKQDPEYRVVDLHPFDEEKVFPEASKIDPTDPNGRIIKGSNIACSVRFNKTVPTINGIITKDWVELVPRRYVNNVDELVWDERFFEVSPVFYSHEYEYGDLLEENKVIAFFYVDALSKP